MAMGMHIKPHIRDAQEGRKQEHAEIKKVIMGHEAVMCFEKPLTLTQSCMYYVLFPVSYTLKARKVVLIPSQRKMYKTEPFVSTLFT